MSDKYDPALPPPESIKVFTSEGNLTLMTELVAQANEFKRKIEREEKDVALWTKRLELARSQNDPTLWELTEEELRKHKRALLQAQMELSTLKDKKANLRFQHKAPSAEQKFRTSQAEYLVNQFREMGIDPDGAKLEKEFRIAAAEDELAALKERAGVSQAIALMAQSAVSAPKALSDLTPGDLRRGASLGKEILVVQKRYRRIDAINLGTPTDEKTHDLIAEGEIQRTRLESTFPNGRHLADEGIGFSQKVSFRFSGFTPDQDVLLLFRVDVGQKHEVETAVDGAPIKTRPLEIDESRRWRHETVLVPAAHVLMDDMIVSRTPTEGTTSNLYGAWAYQLESAREVLPEEPRGEAAPLTEESPRSAAPLVSGGALSPQAEERPSDKEGIRPSSRGAPSPERRLPTLEELLADTKGEGS